MNTQMLPSDFLGAAVNPMTAPALRSEGAASIVVLPGDGIGPEVTRACLKVMRAACPGIDWIVADAGASVVARGIDTGVPPETLEAIGDARAVLKGPMETPVGHGAKSTNVTIRKMFELYGNVRPVTSLPGVRSPFSDWDLDFLVVRENVEDLYAGIEHMQTPDVAQCLKLISRTGSEKVIRLAFALARSKGKRSVHCATKANIMKLTEGLFKTVFEEVAAEFPDIDAHHMLIDNCAHQLVLDPGQFDLIVTTNMNGDIISDLTAGLVGGLGIAPSANIGKQLAMFEPVHGSAPDLAGQNRANPTAMIRSGALMLHHLGHGTAADRIERAIAQVYRKGTQLTRDVAVRGSGVSTERFTDALIEALDTVETRPVEAKTLTLRSTGRPERGPVRRETKIDGVDIFVEWRGTVDDLVTQLKAETSNRPVDLTLISNRGTMVYPECSAFVDTVDHWRCRFMIRDGILDRDEVIRTVIEDVGKVARWMHIEKLLRIDGQPGYSRAQGEA